MLDYPYGRNNVVYKAEHFAEGKSVTCLLWKPNLVREDEITLHELGYGLYAFPYTFDQYGIYHGLFFEDGQVVKFHSFRIAVSRVI